MIILLYRKGILHICKRLCFYIQMDGLAIMGCSNDTLKTIGITKFGDIALRGLVSQKVFLGGNSRCRESRKKELANIIRTGKSFRKTVK